MSVAAYGFDCLQQVLNLGQIGIRIAVIDERVEKLRCLPEGLGVRLICKEVGKRLLCLYVICNVSLGSLGV
jgi:hypothetical protein